MRLWAYIQTNLRAKLFLSYLFIVAVSVVTLFLAATEVGSAYFNTAMQNMMGSGMMGSGSFMSGSTATMTPTASDVITATFRDSLMHALIIATILATLVALAVSVFISRRIAAPVRAMLVSTTRIGAGHYDERVPLPPGNSQDELGQLAASFNEMASSLEQTEQRRLELVGDVAHELRTPIATLQGYLEGLLDGVVEPTDETWAKLLAESGRLRRLADDLQTLSRAEAGQIPTSMQSVAPQALVDAAVDRLSQQYQEKNITLESHVADGLTPVYADPDRAIQVLTNLMTNALRYTPEGGHVDVTVTQSEGRVWFRVRDSGIGITAEQLPHIFERFYRAEKSRARALGGSGIGLTIARALAQAMGGELTAESAGAGKGSTFTFMLVTAPVVAPAHA